MSKIEWTNKTWNPIVSGCSMISEGCTNCYAMKMANRLEAMGIEKYKGLTKKTIKGNIVWNGKVKIDMDDKALFEPLNRKKPTIYFVNSMTDLFHKDVPFEAIDMIMAVIALSPQHTFQVLTKRPERMKKYFEIAGGADIQRVMYKLGGYENEKARSFSLPLPNLWLGVSVENQEQADKRIPYLLETPAKVRFLSCEPLLEYITLAGFDGEKFRPFLDRYAQYENKMCGTGIDWVIVGGESGKGGKGARPMHPDWVRTIRNQCQEAGVPFFFKQWGEWLSMDDFKDRIDEFENKEFKTINQFEDSFPAMVKVGKHTAGRLLDGFEYNEMPNL